MNPASVRLALASVERAEADAKQAEGDPSAVRPHILLPDKKCREIGGAAQENVTFTNGVSLRVGELSRAFKATSGTILDTPPSRKRQRVEGVKIVASCPILYAVQLADRTEFWISSASRFRIASLPFLVDYAISFTVQRSEQQDGTSDAGITGQGIFSAFAFANATSPGDFLPRGESATARFTMTGIPSGEWSLNVTGTASPPLTPPLTGEAAVSLGIDADIALVSSNDPPIESIVTVVTSGDAPSSTFDFISRAGVSIPPNTAASGSLSVTASAFFTLKPDVSGFLWYDGRSLVARVEAGFYSFNGQASASALLPRLPTFDTLVSQGEIEEEVVDVDTVPPLQPTTPCYQAYGGDPQSIVALGRRFFFNLDQDIDGSPFREAVLTQNVQATLFSTVLTEDETSCTLGAVSSRNIIIRQIDPSFHGVDSDKILILAAGPIVFRRKA